MENPIKVDDLRGKPTIFGVPPISSPGTQLFRALGVRLKPGAVDGVGAEVRCRVRRRLHAACDSP